MELFAGDPDRGAAGTAGTVVNDHTADHTLVPPAFEAFKRQKYFFPVCRLSTSVNEEPATVRSIENEVNIESTEICNLYALLFCDPFQLNRAAIG